MTYSVKEIFYTLQGEGAYAGRPAVFCRFSGCNLWSGLEKDRRRSICHYCDTDFVNTDGPHGGKFVSVTALVSAIQVLWPTTILMAQPFIVCTGGEPLLQLDQSLVNAMHRAGFAVAIETNGTLKAPDGIDWICVSPKAGADLVLDKGDELKLVYPQVDLNPEHYQYLDFTRFYLQPMDGPAIAKNTQLALDYCLQNPRWSLSLQIHKQLGIV